MTKAKHPTLLAAFALCLALLPTVFADNALAADPVTWSLSGDTLTISGTGRMTDYDSPSDAPWYASRASIKTVVVQPGVTSIGDNAFCSCVNLTSVSIPDRVLSIGYGAFEDCRALTSVTIPASVWSVGGSAFMDCGSLTAIHVAPGNEYYYEVDGVLFNKASKALQQCPGGRTGAYTVPDGVAEIWNTAFQGCGALTSVTVPIGVTRIGTGAFYGCYSLTEIRVAAGNESFCDVDGVLFTKDRTTLLQCPAGRSGAYAAPDGVTGIRESAFYCCDRLTGVTLPSGVTSIGDWAFLYCDGLTGVTLPASLTSVGYAAFEGCDALTVVYYGGTEADRDTIEIDESNECLTEAAWQCNGATDNALGPLVRSGAAVTATVALKPGTRATAVCAAYDAAGRLLGAKAVALNEGVNRFDYAFSAGSARVKVFVLGQNKAPLLPCAELAL